LNRERFEVFLNQLQLGPESTALYIACGKVEFLVKMSELYRIKGVGVDISAYFIQEARKKAMLRVPDALLDFIEIDGKDCKPQDGKLFDLSSCIGATWIWNGYKVTLKALKDMTKPGGLLVGEPFWLKQPENECPKAENLQSRMPRATKTMCTWEKPAGLTAYTPSTAQKRTLTITRCSVGGAWKIIYGKIRTTQISKRS